MQWSVNKIEQITLKERTFNPLVDQIGETRVIEINEKGIRTYSVKDKSEKKLDVRDVPVSEEEIRGFFDEMYDFARSADMSCTTLDDTCHRVTFYYGNLHKEIFEGALCRGDEVLAGRIHNFVKKYC